MRLKKLSELETDISFSALSYDLCAPWTQGRVLGRVSVELHLPSETIRLALVPLPAELLSGTWQTECLCWHPGRDMMMIACVQHCVRVPCLWSSDCDLEGWGWLDKFAFLEDPRVSSFIWHCCSLGCDSSTCHSCAPGVAHAQLKQREGW